MFKSMFPKSIDNSYHGKTVALWLFYLITAITLVRSLIHLITPDGGAQSITTISLESYRTAGANTVIFAFSLWDSSQLIMGLVYALVL